MSVFLLYNSLKNSGNLISKQILIPNTTPSISTIPSLFPFAKLSLSHPHKDVQLLIFPECSLTGYPPRDISNSSCVNFNLVQSMCDRLQSVADQNDISFIVGTIFKEKEIYNRALLFQPNKQIKSYDAAGFSGSDGGGGAGRG